MPNDDDVTRGGGSGAGGAEGEGDPAGERIRRRLDGAAEPADPAGAYEAVVEKKAARRVRRRAGTVALAVAVVAATAGGTYALIRAFGGGSGQPAAAPTTTEPTPSESASPTESPTVTPSPTPTCSGSITQITADFDGDGTDDTTTVVPPDCPWPDPFDRSPQPDWGIAVTWGDGSAGAWPLPECSADACAAVGSIPMNDGTNALVLETAQGASTTRYALLNVLPSETGPDRYLVIAPAAPGFPAGKPPALATGGSVTHLSFFTCQGGPYPGGGDMATIISTRAVLSQDQSTYTVTQTILAHGPNAGQAEVIVVSQDAKDVAFDAFDPANDVAGVPCWDPGSTPSP